MTIRPDTFVVNCVNAFAPTCGRKSRTLFGRAVVVFLLSLIAGSAVMAQVPADDEAIEVAVPARAERQIIFLDQQFDRIAFGRAEVIVIDGRQVIQLDEQTAAESDARKRWNSVLAAQVQAMDRLYSLSEPQKKKLLLAGKGDIHQHFSRLAEIRSKVTAGPLQREQFAALMKELQPIQNATRENLFDDNSLFQKTLRTILTDEQRRRFRSIELEQQRRILESVMQDWDLAADRFKLWGEPRKKFIELLVPRLHISPSAGAYSHSIVFLEAWRIREQVRPLLTADEWKKFEWQVERAKDAIPILEARGLWTARLVGEVDQASDTTKE